MSRKKWRKLVGIGARRIVYAKGARSVIKFAKNKSGIRSNRREVEFYRDSPLRLRKHLGKIRDSGGKWIVMKMYRRKFPDSRKYRRKLRRLKKLFRKHRIAPYEMYSSRTHRPNGKNLRLDRKGKIIVIDYGNFQYKYSASKSKKHVPAHPPEPIHALRNNPRSAWTWTG